MRQAAPYGNWFSRKFTQIAANHRKWYVKAVPIGDILRNSERLALGSYDFMLQMNCVYLR